MNYPNNIKKNNKSVIIYGNRGMNLESNLNLANNYYVEKDIALIYKKPTPIGIVDVSYENNKGVITKAYFKEPSTLDYNGLYKGKYIEFEAKEAKNKTAFPLANIHEHQVKHIRNVLKHSGIVFIIINMNGQNYLLKGDDFINYIDTNSRKSIAFNYIQEKGYLIKDSYNGLDYISIVDKIYFGGKI